MRRRISADALVLCGLLLLLALVSFRLAGEGSLPEDKERPRRSVSSPRPGGWKALYLVLQSSGVTAVKVERPPEDWPDNLRVMVTGPEYLRFGGATAGSDSKDPSAWTARQVTDALRWVGGKRTLIIFTNRPNELTRKLGLDVAAKGKQDATLYPLQPVPALSWVDGLHVPTAVRWSKTPQSAVPLFADQAPAVVLFRHGAGTVVAVSDAGVVDNQTITELDNARFITDLIRTYAGAGGRVGFDEYHQGFQEADNFWDAVGRPGQLAAWQLLGLTLLIVYSAGRRFGLPRPLPASSRVSSEYVASLADLYRRAGAADAALEGVYLSFWRDLCRAVALSYDAPTDEVVRRAARTLGTGDKADLERRLHAIVGACEAKIDEGKVRDRDLLPLARDLEAMRKELGLGGEDREPAARG